MKVTSVIIVAILIYFVKQFFQNYWCKSNVCRTFDDYYTNRDTNKNCYYNPDYLLTAPEIIIRHGYPLETHNVTTDDGYILTLFRIPHGRNTNTTKRGKPVFLQHGFLINCGMYVNIGQKSLAFILANEGYDVWLGNFRGSKYSTQHKTLTKSDSAYWDFSHHEFGIYDLPAQISYVSKATNKTITYIGFSMATTAMFVYGIYYPEKAAKEIDLCVCFAPYVVAPEVDTLITYLKASHLQAFTLFTDKVEFSETLLKYLCFPYPFQMKMCYLPVNVMGGFADQQHDPENFPSTIMHLYDTAVIKTGIHLLQNLESEKFAHFDYGSEKNLILYGTAEPPIYNLTKALVNFYLIRSEYDLEIRKEAVDYVQSRLQRKSNPYKIHVIRDEGFTHINFLNGKDVMTLYKHVVQFLEKHVK